MVAFIGITTDGEITLVFPTVMTHFSTIHGGGTKVGGGIWAGTTAGTMVGVGTTAGTMVGVGIMDGVIATAGMVDGEGTTHTGLATTMAIIMEVEIITWEVIELM